MVHLDDLVKETQQQLSIIKKEYKKYFKFNNENPWYVNEMIESMKASEKTSMILVPEGGLEPPQAQGSSDFESDASTSSTTPARVFVYYQSSQGFAREEPGLGL